MDEKTALTYAITKALAYQENGGKIPKIPKAGKTGELASIFQFTPNTWKGDAKTYLGDANAQLTADNETTVMTKKVRKWIDEGYDVKQIASMHNAGIGEPNAYTGKFSTGNPSKGMNKKYNVPYDVPSYANSVSNYAKQFYTNDFKSQIKPMIPTVQSNSVSPFGGIKEGLMQSLASAQTKE